MSQRTLRKDYAALHTIFQWAMRSREYRPDNPVAKAQRPKRGDERQPGIVGDAEVERLLAACGDRPMLRLFVLLCYETAVRPNSEALWLRWEDVDLADGFLTIVSGRDGHRTKTGRTRRVPISARLRDALRDHAAAYRLGGAPWLFHHEATRRHARAGARVVGLLDSFRASATRAGLPTLVPYDLRHSRLTRWAATHPLPVVQKAAGHASIATTLIYVHLGDEALRDLVAPAADARAVASSG